MTFSIRNTMIRNRIRMNQLAESNNEKADRVFIRSNEKATLSETVSPMIKIKIIKCSDPLDKHEGPRWYKHRIGEVFEINIFSFYVPMYDLPMYILSDNRGILMSDVEEIKETKMKVVEKNVDNKTIYPCLKTTRPFDDRRIVVLFTAQGEGVCLLSHDNRFSVGDYSETWNEHAFELYKGTLEISNGD